MIILPLIERELRVQSRKPAFYWGRLASGWVAGLICALALIGNGPVVTDKGGVAFGILVVLLCFIALSGFLLTCDSVAREQREGTLGLLLLTRISPTEVILGKLSTVGLGSLSALGAAIPVIAVCLVAGGVTRGEVVRMGLALATLLVVSLSAGVWSSVAGGSRLMLAARALAILAAILAVPATGLLGFILLPVMCCALVLGFRCSFWSRIRGLLTLLAAVMIPVLVLLLSGAPQLPLLIKRVSSMNPIVAVLDARDPSYRVNPNDYWHSLAGGMFMAGLLIIGATKRLGSAVRDEEAQARAAEVISKESSTQMRIPSPQLVGEDPIGWLIRRNRWMRVAVWVAAVLLFIIPLAGMWFSIGRLVVLVRYYSIFLIAYQMIPYGLFAWVATDFYWTARQSGALELLSVTPLGKRGLADGYWKALTKLFRKPVWTSVVLQIVPYGFSWRHGPWPSAWVSFVYYAVSLVAFLMMMRALCAVGGWTSLRARSHTSAVLVTLALTVIIPYIIGMVASWIIVAVAINSQPALWISPLIVTFRLAYFCGLYRYARRAMQELDAGTPWLAADFGAAARKAFIALRTWKTV